MAEFFCPDCGKDVKAPHFCECKHANEGVGIAFKITIPLGTREPDKPMPADPYAEQKAHFKKQLDDGYITQGEYDNQMKHIERYEKLWRTLNGKEED